MHQNIRLGLIGAGKWGVNYIKTIESIKGLELRKIACKTSISKKKVLFPSYNFTDSWQEVIESKEIDGVIIATPPNEHFEMALKCIENRKPLIIEKPFTLSLRDAESLLLLSEKKQVNVKVNHIYLYHPLFRLLKENISEKSTFTSIYSMSGNHGPFRKDITPLWDWGPHDIAMCLAIINKSPYKIEAKYLKKDLSSLTKKSNVNIKLYFKENYYADLNFGNFMNEKKRLFKVNFEDSSLIFDPINYSKIKKEIGHKKMDLINMNSQKTLSLNQNPLEVLLKEFSSEVINSRFNLSDILLAKKVVSILEIVDKELMKN